MTRPLRTVLATMLTTFLMVGCSGDMSDLRAYSEKIKQRSGEQVPPIPEFEPYQSFTYVPEELRDPFRVQTGFAEPEPTDEDGGSGIKPPSDHRTEPLERFPLDSLDMVGTLSQDNTLWALIRDPEGAVHQVTQDNYLGQNYGRITGIHPNRVALVEIIPDGQDGWMEREAAIGMSDE